MKETRTRIACRALIATGATALAAMAQISAASAQVNSPLSPGAAATAGSSSHDSDPDQAQPPSAGGSKGLPAPSGRSGAARPALEEIVVTAQKRRENLQDTPVTVSAISGATAAAKGVNSTSDLQIVTPGLVFADSGAGPAVYLRGVGTQNTAPGDEGSVSTYVDGVYNGSLPDAFSSLANVQRVEVLKGPQGTLFGRNATGGLINIITRDPSFKPSLDASVDAGNYATVGGEIYATAPITSNLAANVSGYYNNQLDGWGTNVHNGQAVYKSVDVAVRTKLMWEPTSTTQFILAGDYARSRDANAAGAISPGAVGIGGNAALSNFYNLDASLQPLQINKTGGVSLHAQQDLPWARLLSITAYRQDNYLADFDNDRSGLQIVDVGIRYNDKQFTQELQVSSLPSSRIKWIAGMYYLDEHTHLTAFDLVGLGLAAAGGSLNTPATQKTRSVAGYGQFTVPLGWQTNLTGGLRYTDDHRSINSYSILGFGITLPGVPQTSDYGKLTYRVSMDHHFAPNLMVYASYNRGFKSGVFNLYSPSVPGVRPETLDAYEIGVKSEFFDRRLRVNVAPFYYDYNNIQLVQAFIDTTRLLNAAKATSKGVDADVTALVAPGLTLDSSVEYLHARYDSFLNAPATVPAPATCTPVPTELPGPPTGGNINCTIDASGNQLIRAPEFTGELGATYEWSTSLGSFSVNGNVFYSSSFPYEASGRLKQNPYEVVNAQVSWTSPTDKYGIRLFARNLGDEHYFTNRVSSGADSFAAAAPLTGGIQFSVHY